jgi:hypothetical protein
MVAEPSSWCWPRIARPLRSAGTAVDPWSAWRPIGRHGDVSPRVARRPGRCSVSASSSSGAARADARLHLWGFLVLLTTIVEALGQAIDPASRSLIGHAGWLGLLKTCSPPWSV